METRWKVFQAAQVARYDELPLTNVPLFAEEDFSGCVLGFLPGQELSVHHHDHEHEVFDVLEGIGTMFLDDESIEVKAGSVIFVPAGVRHGFKNTSNSRWLIRATIYQRTYARHAIKRAIDKRLGLARK
jgi:mannose-6-phosphate isomerase-like protein (cupin superfamily)